MQLLPESAHEQVAKTHQRPKQQANLDRRFVAARTITRISRCAIARHCMDDSICIDFPYSIIPSIGYP